MYTHTLPVAALLILLPLTAFSAPADLPGSKDHPLITRYPDTHIIQYRVSEFDQISLPTSKAYLDANFAAKHPKQTIEGKITTIEYQANSRLPFLQIYRNFQFSLTRAGFKILFQCETVEDCGPQFSADFFATAPIFKLEKLVLSGGNNEAVRHAYVVGKLRKGAADIYVSVMVAEEKSADWPAYIILDIVETKPMQDNLVGIDTKFLSQSIESDGKAILKGVLFDTDKATLKAESDSALKAIADYLAINSSANVFIVGHTDTAGTYAHNVDLSTRRAEAVASALTKNYKIDAKRLQAIGIGPAAPVSSNASEDGRAINRRVEMVLR